MIALFSARSWFLILCAIVITATSSFAIGFYTKDQFFQAEQLKVVNKEIQKAAVNIVKSVETSERIETEVSKMTVKSDEVKKAVVKRLKVNKEKQIEKQINQVVPMVCPEFRLDVGTVWLLNAQRKGISLESASGSDEALSSPSAIGIEEFTLNDIDVVKMYHDLAKRHDELVDSVEEKLREQAAP